MKPEFDGNGVQIYLGDCREVLRQLPSESVHCCVTSPPYWGLRDYGTASWEGGLADCDHISRPNQSAKSKTNGGALRDNPYRSECGKCGATRIDRQIGLEDSPVKYIATMREVFAEVRRVLRSDGTLWLNIGDSYSGSWGNYGGQNRGNGTQRTIGNGSQAPNPAYDGLEQWRPPNAAVPGLKPKDLVGIPWMLAFALREPWTNWRIKTEAMRAWVGGIVDGEGCITILRTKSSHSGSLSFPPVVQVRMCDMEPLQRLVDVAGSSFGKPQMPPSHLAASQRESYQWKLVSESAAEVIAEIYPFLTCKRKQAIVAWNHQQFRSARGNQERKNGDLEKEQFCKELINKLNQRQPADIPSWMKEPSVKQEPGWYLRQDLIWAKPNPMPESVTDRCTKSHEYIFLLAKSERYFYNAEAIKTPLKDTSVARLIQDVEGQNGSDRVPGKSNGNMKAVKFGGNKQCPDSRLHSGKEWTPKMAGGGTSYKDGHSGYFSPDGEPLCGIMANKKSVWQVTTQGFADAHFAVFPAELIKPCILAGCPEGGTVLDPFMGSGTTGLVARSLHSKAIGIELNPAYIEIAAKRLSQFVLPL